VLMCRSKQKDTQSGLQATVQVNNTHHPETLHSLTAANRRTIIDGKVMTGRKVHGGIFCIGTAFELGPAGTAYHPSISVAFHKVHRVS